MNNVLISKLPHTWGSLSLNGQLSRDYEHHLEIQRHIHIFYIVSHKSSHAHFSHVGLVGSAVLKSHWLQLKCNMFWYAALTCKFFKLIGIWCWLAAFHIIYPPMNPLLMSCTLISALFVLMIMKKSWQPTWNNLNIGKKHGPQNRTIWGSIIASYELEIKSNRSRLNQIAAILDSDGSPGT